MKSIKVFSFLTALTVSATCSFAVSILVAPSTGLNGSNPTNSIADAIAQVNAGGDASNTITLRSTEGAHILPANTTWTFTAGKNVSFAAESGQPVVRLSHTAGAYMLIINAGATETISFTGIGFVPPTGLTYGHNVADAFNCQAGNYTFINCVFSSNNGTDGVASQEGAVAFVDSAAGNNVGDDWFYFTGLTSVATFSNCTLTGAFDEAILIGVSATTGATLRIDTGTCIANNGGAAIQVANKNVTLELDGSAGRVLIANNGTRTGQISDTGIKIFWDAGCSFSMIKTDVVTHTNANIFDFEGVPTISITDSRVAFGNTVDIGTAGLLAIDDVSADSPYLQTINITRSTFHDNLGGGNSDGIIAQEGASEPGQNYTIIDSIFSGAGDTYANMRNNTASAGAGSLSNTFSAVVTAGPHALANAGDLGAGSVSADPQYVATTYTIGRNQSNPDFLLPASASYANAASNGQRLKGGAPGNVAGVSDWTIY